MKWRARAVPSRAKERANISFFIFVMFFAVFGVIVLTELLLLERPNAPGSTRSRYNEDQQGWEGRTETGGGDNGEPPPPAHAPLDAVWQPVAGTRFRFYVYSAYVERRTVAAVRIIAATKTRGADPVVCRLWLADNRTLTLKAKVKAIRENWNLKYSATYVLCLLRDSGVKPHETVGASISVVASATPNRPPTNLLTVLDTEPKSGIEETLHVCVKPFHFSYAREDWLVEWFEMNRLLGASHFYMYNESLSAPVGCLLDYYRKQGLVTLLPWKLPIVSKVEIRTEGQFAAFNDCLYRSMSNAGWLLVIDVDEVVVPRRERSLPALLSALRASYNPPSKAPSAFLFRNAFFYLRWQDDTEAKAPLVTARKTRRWATPHAIKNRSKYALRPRDAVELGNHFVWELAPGASSVGVPTDRGLLHHYRIACEYGGMNCLTVPSTVDRTAHRWTEELQKRVEAEEKQLATFCPEFRFYVYSAYVERRTVAAVRIIAATKTRGADPVVCRLWLADNRTLTLKAKVKAIRENWNLKYSATYVLCLLRDSGVKPHETVGASISVVASATPNRPPTNLLTVLDTEPKSGIEETLHVCVKPFHFSYAREDWLVEWFEMNRLLGASHFYMYNESLSAPVGCLLDYYRKQGLVTLLPWKLPIVSKVEIRTEGQFAAFNDCLYRSMSNAGWLLVIDVDEVVVPRRERSLPALLSALRASYNPPSKAPSAFLFRNAFFYLRWQDDTEAKAPLVTARKTRRWATPHAIKNRSKYALRPRDAVELGNHFVWELAPGASSVGVPTDRGLLHHYRIACEYGGMNCLTVPSTVDRTAHRWTEELQKRVEAEEKQLATFCPE